VDKLRLMHQRLSQTQGAGDETAMAEGETDDLLDHLPVAVFTLDLQGRILYGNRRAEQLSGYSIQELRGRRYYETDLARFKDLMKITALFGLSRREQESGPFHLTMCRKDGSLVRIEITMRLVQRGGVRQILCVSREAVGTRSHGVEGVRAAAAWQRGSVPLSLCASCKKVEDTTGDWIPLEYFLYRRLELEFTHQTCPDCMERRRLGEHG